MAENRPARRLSASSAIDRQARRVHATGMIDKIPAAAQGAMVPLVEQIEYQRRMNRDRRMQTARRLPGAVAHAGDKLALVSRSACSGSRAPLHSTSCRAFGQARRPALASARPTNRRTARCRRRPASSPSTYHGSIAVRSSMLHAAVRRLRQSAGSGTRSAARTSRRSIGQPRRAADRRARR